MKKMTTARLIPGILFMLNILFFLPASALACEIELGVNGQAKPVYSVGDEVVIKVSVFLTHRNCPEGIESTDFKTSGLEILGATDWTEVSRSEYERLVKVRITDAKNGTAVLYAERVCSKEGGKGSITLKVQTA